MVYEGKLWLDIHTPLTYVQYPPPSHTHHFTYLPHHLHALVWVSYYKSEESSYLRHLRNSILTFPSCTITLSRGKSLGRNATTIYQVRYHEKLPGSPMYRLGEKFVILHDFLLFFSFFLFAFHPWYYIHEAMSEETTFLWARVYVKKHFHTIRWEIRLSLHAFSRRKYKMFSDAGSYQFH